MITKNPISFKLWCIILLGVILFIPLISAAEWDNIKSYDAETKTVTITNWLGLGNDLAKITLDYNTDYCISDCYAEGTTILYHEGQLMQDVYFTPNVVMNYKVLIQDGTIEKEYPIYENKCELINNKTTGLDDNICHNEFKEWGKDNIPNWKEYNKDNLPEGTYKWRLEGKKGKFENTDWIASWEGKEVTEWATFNSTFQNGLFLAYNMNNNNATIGYVNMTNTSSTAFPSFNATDCMNGNCSHFSGNGMMQSPSTLTNFSGTKTLNFWFKVNDSTNPQALFANGTYGLIALEGSAGVPLYFQARYNGDGVTYRTPYGIKNNTWYMVTITTDNDRNLTAYVNGTIAFSSYNNKSDGTSITNFNNIAWSWGYSPTDGGAFGGAIDEVYWWNRKLDVSEVKDLYNVGAGIFNSDSGTLIGGINAPPNNTIYTTQNASFNCWGYAVGQSLTNISLWTNASGTFAYNGSVAVSGSSASALFYRNFTNGAYNWTCSACGDAGGCNFVNETRIFNIQVPPIVYNLSLLHISPPDWKITNNSKLSFNCSANNYNILNTSLIINDLIVNTSANSSASTNYTYVLFTNSIAIPNPSNWTCRSCNSSICFTHNSNYDYGSFGVYKFALDTSTPSVSNAEVKPITNTTTNNINCYSNNTNFRGVGNVTLLVNNVVNTSKSSPVPIFVMDFDYPTTPKDRSIFNHTITKYGTMIGGSSPIIGNSYSFKGNASTYLKTPHINLGNNFTVSLWINYSELATTQMLISSDIGGTMFSSPNMFYTAGTNLYFYVNGTFGTAWTHGMTANNSYHLVLVRNFTTSELFINNVSKGSRLTPGNRIDTVFNIIGQLSGGSYPFSGEMDELYIFDRRLTNAEISDLYNIKAKSQRLWVEEVNQSFTTNLPSGQYNFTCKACSYGGNCLTSTAGGMLIDATIPLISYNSTYNPINNSYTNKNWFTIALNWVETNFQKVVYYLYDSANNLLDSFTSTDSTNKNHTFTDLDNATYRYNVTIWDTLNNTNSTELRTITSDASPPQFNVIAPNGYDLNVFAYLGTNYTFTVNMTSQFPNLDKCWVVWNGTNISITHPTTNYSCYTNTSFKFGFGNVALYANDTAGNLGFLNYTINSSVYFSSQTYNSQTTETKQETFTLNISFDISSYISSQVNLIYNGTSYTGNVTNNITTVTIDIPLINNMFTNKTNSFYWNINRFDGTNIISQNSTTYLQNVSRINLERCNATYNYPTINMTAFDETDGSAIIDLDVGTSYDYWIGSGTVKKENSFQDYDNESVSMCMFPNSSIFKIDQFIEYGDNNVTYTTRNYWQINHTITNVTQNLSLYLLKSTEITTFIIKVIDVTSVPIPDAYVYIQKYYPGTDEYKTVQVVKTDSNGKTVGFYQTETVDYRHIIVVDGVTVLTTGRGKIFAESAPYTLTFTIGEVGEVPWNQFNNLADLTYNMSYSNNTHKISFSYSDTSGVGEGARLYVLKDIGNDTSNVCNTSLALSSGLITCDLSSYSSGKFYSRGFITRSGVEYLVDFQIYELSDIIQTFGKAGLFLAWLLIITAGMLFLLNPVVGIWGTTGMVIFVTLIGLASFSPLFIFGMIAIGIVLTILFGKGGGY